MPCTRQHDGDRLAYTTADAFTAATILGARFRDSGTCISSVAWSDFTTPRTERPVRFVKGHSWMGSRQWVRLASSVVR